VQDSEGGLAIVSVFWVVLLGVLVASSAAIVAFGVPSARRVRILKVRAAALRNDIEPLSRALLTDFRQTAKRIRSHK
jgi:hypothetical protein